MKVQPIDFDEVKRLILLSSWRALNIICSFIDAFIKYLFKKKKNIYYVPCPEEDIVPGLKGLLCSSNESLITFLGVPHMYGEVANYQKVFDSAILCSLVFLMFMPILGGSQGRYYSPFFTVGSSA